MKHIIVQRSRDVHNDAVWLAYELDDEAKKCVQLYLGNNVNEAILAATAAGLPKNEAVGMAKSALARGTVDKIIE